MRLGGKWADGSPKLDTLRKMNDARRYQPVGRGETVPDKYGDYCKYEDVEHWIGMYNLCNEREQLLLSERNQLRELIERMWNETVTNGQINMPTIIEAKKAAGIGMTKEADQ